MRDLVTAKHVYKTVKDGKMRYRVEKARLQKLEIEWLAKLGSLYKEILQSAIKSTLR